MKMLLVGVVFWCWAPIFCSSGLVLFGNFVRTCIYEPLLAKSKKHVYSLPFPEVMWFDIALPPSQKAVSSIACGFSNNVFYICSMFSGPFVFEGCFVGFRFNVILEILWEYEDSDTAEPSKKTTP